MTKEPAAASASKPILRGLHNATIKRNLGVSLVLTAIVTVAFKLWVNDPKEKAYGEFYKTYDGQKSFERMKANGRFQSC